MCKSEISGIFEGVTKCLTRELCIEIFPAIVKNKLNLIYYYFLRCDLTRSFLNNLKKRNIIDNLLVYDTNNNLLHMSASHGKNYSVLIKWVVENYEPSFVHNFISTKAENGNSFLVNCLENFNKESFISII